MFKRMLGETIYQLRKAKGLSQSELAELVGVSNKAVSKWETYEANPDITLLPLLAVSLGVTTDVLLSDIKSEKNTIKPTANEASDEIIITVLKSIYENNVQYINKYLDEMKGLSAKEKITGLLAEILKNQNFHTLDDLLCKNINPHLIMAILLDNINKAAPIFAKLFKEGIEDGSITTEFPDECADVFLVLVNTWCNPLVFECDITILKRRLTFLHQMLKQMGADILNDELIKDYMKYIENNFMV